MQPSQTGPTSKCACAQAALTKPLICVQHAVVCSAVHHRQAQMSVDGIWCLSLPDGSREGSVGNSLPMRHS